MDKITQPLLSQAAQYGLAFFIMALAITGLLWAVIVLWKSQVKRDEQNQDVIKENTVAFKDLQNSINLLTAKL